MVQPKNPNSKYWPKNTSGHPGQARKILEFKNNRRISAPEPPHGRCAVARTLAAQVLHAVRAPVRNVCAQGAATCTTSSLRWGGGVRTARFDSHAYILEIRIAISRVLPAAALVKNEKYRFLGKSTLVKVTVARAGEFCSSSDVVSVTYEDLLVLVRVEVAAGVTYSLLLVVCVAMVTADQQARLCESVEAASFE
ncbi:LOB domain-containing protein 25-like [Dorcoceras hygrometricum]|uniref:LOB domain-containing protein 25-like n=1 Tax=Dorcoceras hygrometricum TaxID=472368 RepID=A0A2Z7AT02_9LAMI|nr:LOB domain-containing protein 25-like [Dorcoceras hygrometricum]